LLQSKINESVENEYLTNVELLESPSDQRAQYLYYPTVIHYILIKYSPI